MASLLVVGGGFAGCGGEDKASGVKAAKLPEGTRSEGIEHEACSESGNRVEVLDANNDGKPDIKRVYDKSTGKEVCRISDLNHDGKPDLFEYFDPSGELRRREADYDDNGVVDSVEYFEHGKLVRREYDTTGQHRIDTWDFFDPATGKLIRRERDATNDGRVDQWWTWEGDKVTIAIDKSGDGKPDPEATIVLGGTADAGAPSGPAAPPPPSLPPTQPQQSDTTTAVDAGTPLAAADAGPKRKEKR